MLLTLCDDIEEPFWYEEFLSLQPMFPPQYFDNFSHEGGCSEGLDAFRFFVNKCSNLVMLYVFVLVSLHGD